MSLSSDDTDDGDIELLKAIAWTPAVAPFQGTDCYGVHTCLGEGGFGVVYEVEDRATGRRLALKTLKPQRSGFAANIRRLKREFRSVADLVHPNLVGLHELSSHGQRWFFTMDLVRGCDFKQYVRPGDVLDERRLRGAIAQLVAGVATLHQANVLHRDLKPSNVLVEPNGHVVILDFGLAGDDIDPGLYLAGTPSFMSPEQIAGKPVTAASDWYSVGVMLHEALTGALPATTHVLAAAHVPDDLRRLCEALLHPEPDERPSVGEIRAMLGEQSDGEVRHDVARFVGRAGELAHMHAAYSAMRDGATRVVRIHGAPGVGKSSLIARFCGELADDTLVLASKCHERESVPFKAFDGVIDLLVAHLKSLSHAELAAVLPHDIALATQLFPVFGELDAVRDMRRGAVPADPAELRARSFRALRELVASLAAARPLVIVVDDLQWGDIDSTRLLLHMLAPPQARMLVVLVYRSDDATANGTLRETLRMLDAAGIISETLGLAALPGPEARELAELLIGEGAAAQTIAERGEGHPMFISELARGFARREVLDEIPNLIDMLWRRVGRLEPQARALVEIIAVAGGPLPHAVCCKAAGLDDSAMDVVRQLRAERLLRAGDGELNVFHDRIRDAVSTFVDAGARKQRHLALAHVLERAANADLEAIARHFDGAGEREPAGRYALRAADAAMAALAFDRAAALYQMAIDRGFDSADSYQRLGDAWLAAGASAAGGRAYLEASQRCEGERSVDLLSIAGRELSCAGDFAAGEAALAKALAAVGERAPGASVKLGALTGVYHIIRMRLAGFRAGKARRPPDVLRLEVLDRAAYGYGYFGISRALGVMMRSGRLGLASGDPKFVGRGLVLAAFGMASNHSERPPIIDELCARASAISREIGDLEIEALALRVRGESYFLYGDLVSAQQLCAQAAALMAGRCRGMGFHRRFTSLVDARAILQLGDLQRARALADTLLTEALDREDPVCADGVRVGGLALYEILADRPDAAKRQLDLASVDDRCANIAFRAEAESILAMYCGDAGAALERWKIHLPKVQDEGLFFVPGMRLLVLRAFCAAALADPSRRRYIARAKRLVRPIRKWPFPLAVATYAGVQANLAMIEGDRDAARAHLERVVDTFTAASYRLDAGAARFARARLLGEDTEPAAAELRRCGVVSPERWAATWYPRIIAG